MTELINVLNYMDFSYKIENNKFYLVDNFGANLGNIENEAFDINENLPVFVMDRLSVYIDDYYASDIVEQLGLSMSDDSIYPYSPNLIEKMRTSDKFTKEFIEEFKNVCDGTLDISGIKGNE